MGRYRIEFTTERRHYAIVEADDRESAITAFEGGRQIEEHEMKGWDDWEIHEVLFEPARECARDGCSERTGPSEGTPTPDEYCTLYCAVEAGAVREAFTTDPKPWRKVDGVEVREAPDWDANANRPIYDGLPSSRADVFWRIEQERARQDGKWGGADHDDTHEPGDWCRYILHHLRRADAAASHGDDLTYPYQLIRVASLAVAALESFNRKARK